MDGLNTTMLDLDDYCLDILGQQPLLNLYTQICLCYTVDDTSSHKIIVDTLTRGLERLAESFPWVAGQVINEGSGEGKPGTFKIKPLAKSPHLVIKDLTRDSAAPTMDALKQASFPINMLDESVIASRNTVPGTSGEPAHDSTPVFGLQATFIPGGLLLTCVGQHQAMDGTGQGQVMHLLDKACRGEPFTGEELTSGNLARRNLIPLLDNKEYERSDISQQAVKPAPARPVSNEASAAQAAPPSPPPATWANFIFSAASLAELKSLAARDLSSGYVSTDDALTALVWQRTTQARLPRLPPTAQTRLSRAVDTRSHLGILRTYPGIVQNMTYHTLPARELAASPAGAVAARLRAAVDPATSDLARATRATATSLDRASDRAAVSFVANADAGADVMLSSWARLGCGGLGFGLGLGPPAAVRRPRFVPFEGLAYLLPRAADGEITLAVCLRDDDLARLRADREFARFARFVG